MKRFAITTLGCKVNQYESEALAESLSRSGWRAARNGESADLCIVNTCTVTHRASMQSRQAVRRCRRDHPDGRLIVTGCYAQTEPEVLAAIDGVSDIVGTRDKSRIAAMVSSGRDGCDGSCRPPQRPAPLPAADEFADLGLPMTSSRTRPFLKIQDGCNAHCTYCIVPQSRGPSRSMPPQTVMRHLRELGRLKRHEVVLAGIHLGCYGTELSPPTTLAHLLADIDRSRPVHRVRLSSIEPQELDVRIIDTVARSAVFCDHFHLPLQSGSDAILKRMARPYRADGFAAKVHRIHAACPDAAIGADVLVGFPGEDASAFDDTVGLIESLPLTYLHVFPFSPRPGTPASRYGSRVPEAEIKRRCSVLRRLGREKRARFHERFVGRRLEVVVEDRRLASGMSGNYIPVRIDPQPTGITGPISVTVTAANADGPLTVRRLNT